MIAEHLEFDRLECNFGCFPHHKLAFLNSRSIKSNDRPVMTIIVDGFPLYGCICDISKLVLFLHCVKKFLFSTAKSYTWMSPSNTYATYLVN